MYRMSWAYLGFKLFLWLSSACMRSRFGTHQSRTHRLMRQCPWVPSSMGSTVKGMCGMCYLWDASSKGRIVLELSFGDTSVGNTSSWHFKKLPENLASLSMTLLRTCKSAIFLWFFWRGNLTTIKFLTRNLEHYFLYKVWRLVSLYKVTKHSFVLVLVRSKILHCIFRC